MFWRQPTAADVVTVTGSTTAIYNNPFSYNELDLIIDIDHNNPVQLQFDEIQAPTHLNVTCLGGVVKLQFPKMNNVNMLFHIQVEESCEIQTVNTPNLQTINKLNIELHKGKMLTKGTWNPPKLQHLMALSIEAEEDAVMALGLTFKKLTTLHQLIVAAGSRAVLPQNGNIVLGDVSHGIMNSMTAQFSTQSVCSYLPFYFDSVTRTESRKFAFLAIIRIVSLSALYMFMSRIHQVSVSIL